MLGSRRRVPRPHRQRPPSPRIVADQPAAHRQALYRIVAHELRGEYRRLEIPLADVLVGLGAFQVVGTDGHAYGIQDFAGLVEHAPVQSVFAILPDRWRQIVVRGERPPVARHDHHGARVGLRAVLYNDRVSLLAPVLDQLRGRPGGIPWILGTRRNCLYLELPVVKPPHRDPFGVLGIPLISAGNVMCKARTPRKPVAKVPHGVVDNRYRYADFQPRTHGDVKTVVQYPARQSRTGRRRRLDIAQRRAAIDLFNVQQGAAPAAKAQLGIDGLGGAVGGPHQPEGLGLDPHHGKHQPQVLGAGVRGHAHRLDGTSREVNRDRVARAELVEPLRVLVERGHGRYEPRLVSAWAQAGNDEQAEGIAGRIGGKACGKPFGPAGLEALPADFQAGSQHPHNRGLVPRPAHAGGRLAPQDGPVANQHRELEGLRSLTTAV